MSVYPYGRISVDVISAPTPTNVIPLRATLGCIHPLVDHYPIIDTDLALKLQPSGGTQTTETTRFTRYVLLLPNVLKKKVGVSIGTESTGHVYISSVAYTHYYRMYFQLYKTRDFTNFTPLTDEVMVMNVSHPGLGTDTWYDWGLIRGVLNAVVDLDAGEFLLLRIRGTSWGSVSAVTSSNGINSTNFRLWALLYI